MTATTSTTPKPGRRRLRFSVRTLLLLVAVLCVGLGWFAHNIRLALEQRETVRAIEKQGGRVWRGAGGLVRLAVSAVLRDADLAGEVSAVSFSDIPITDADLVILRELTRLRELNLRGTQITDTGLVHLRGLTELCDLDLRNTQITDAGLVHLQGLTELRELDLRGTQVTPAAVEGLIRTAWPKLHTINGRYEWDEGHRRRSRRAS